MKTCPRCGSYTMTAYLCASCNYSPETDVTLQPMYARSLAPEIKSQRKLQLMKRNRKEQDCAYEVKENVL